MKIILCDIDGTICDDIKNESAQPTNSIANTAIKIDAVFII